MAEHPVREALFGAHAQFVVGVCCTVIAAALWVLGTIKIPGALALPWHWTPAAFIFHASMFFGVVACWALAATGLGYRATEQVPTTVVEEIKHADEVEVNVDTDS